MTHAPASITALGAYWHAQGGTNLGIVGNKAHTAGYHLGKDRIYGPGGLGDRDYSVQIARDKKGLTNAASAIDLGRLNGSLGQLRSFSRWLVIQCVNHRTGWDDVREIIYSPDGQHVQRWSGVDGQIHTGAGNGDASHLTHTHISFYRDSQNRSKLPLFRPYFTNPPDTSTPGADVDLSTLTIYATPRQVKVPKGTSLYQTLDFSDTPEIVSPARVMPVVGQFRGGGPYLVGYVPDSGAVPAELPWRILRNRDVGALDSGCESVPADCAAAVDAAVAPLKAQIAGLVDDVASAADDERTRIAQSEYDRIEAL